MTIVLVMKRTGNVSSVVRKMTAIVVLQMTSNIDSIVREMTAVVVLKIISTRLNDYTVVDIA